MPRTSPATPPDREKGVRSAGEPPDRHALLGTLARLGFAAVPPGALPASPLRADLWVASAGAKRLLAPVFVERAAASSPGDRADDLLARWSQGFRATPLALPSSSILVVPSDEAAELTGERITSRPPVPLPLAVSRTRILVQPDGVPPAGGPESKAHWHRLRVPPKVLLTLATGALVGLAGRAETSGAPKEGGIPIDVEGMFHALRGTFSLDVEGSLGVQREEDAMFLLYQLALRETYAPGDQGASLHEIVNDPKGPAARLPWFAI